MDQELEQQYEEEEFEFFLMGTDLKKDLIVQTSITNIDIARSVYR